MEEVLKPSPNGPRIPPDLRLVELATAGIGQWFRLHVGESAECACVLARADEACDLGYALASLSSAAREGRLDRHRVMA